MKLARFFGSYLKHYRLWLVIAVAAVLTFAATTAMMISLIEPIFSEVLLAGDEDMGVLGSFAGGTKGAGDPADGVPEEGEGHPWWERFDLQERLDGLYETLKSAAGIDSGNIIYFAPLLFVLVYGIRSLGAFVSGYSFQRIGLGVTTDIRGDLYRRLLDQSSRFHAAHPSGELVSRVINDVTMMQMAVSTRLLDMLQQSVTLLAMLAMLLSIHFKLALLCLVVTPVFLIPVVRFGKGIRGTSHRSQERMADLAHLLTEGIRGHRVVKAFGMEDFEDRRFRQATDRHLRVNLRAQILANMSSPVIETLAALGGAALMVYAGKSIRANELTVSVLVQFLTTLLLMYDPIRKINKANLILQESLAAGHRVADLIAVPDEIVDRADGPCLETLEEAIEFKSVTFSYDEKVVLEDVSLRLESGEMVALVGPSGAGKSTLVNLLPRFFDANAGQVLIDGVSIREIPIKNLRSLIGIVTQETVLFDDTIRNNIAYGRSDLSLDRVREAAKAAYADDFIMASSEGYDTFIGEGGLKLSGGQRQRLAIARALLKNAPILILDEATSPLDSESEALVQKALSNLTEGRTTLVIAHRLSTVTNADRIVVMSAGQIEEQGTHEELVERNGTYKRLYDLQFRVD
ncbi:MAG: ATP-binding cassette domain-containing protein [Deltaproteobacteria bacterium]|nr:ATP-binding cassette domain-containing protein [Deltaproteobacteria bacterium]